MTGQWFYRTWVATILGLLLLTTSPLAGAAQQAVAKTSIIAWNGDGTRLAAVGQDTLSIYDQTLRLLRTRPISLATSLIWSPDGQKLLVGSQIFDPETLETLITFDSEWQMAGWTQDGSATVTLQGDMIAYFDALTGQMARTVLTAPVYNFDLSPDKTRLVTALTEQSVDIVNIATGNLVAQFPQAVLIASLTWSPDSTRIAGATLQKVTADTPGSVVVLDTANLYEVHVWDAATGQVLNQFGPLYQIPVLLSWHPDGHELAGASPSGPIFVWDTQQNRQVDYLLSAGAVRDLEYSPHGGRLVVANNQASLEFIGSENRVAPQHTQFVQRLAQNTIEVFVPNPSVEKLQDVFAQCSAQHADSSALVAAPAALEPFVSLLSLEAGAEIPSACAAELEAVAEALAIAQAS